MKKCRVKQPNSGTHCFCERPKGHTGPHQYWIYRWGKGRPSDTEREAQKALNAMRRAEIAASNALGAAVARSHPAQEMLSILHKFALSNYRLAAKCVEAAGVALVCLLLTGCYTYTPYGCAPVNPSAQMVLNNTPYLLDIYQDGVLIGKAVPTGAIIPVRPVVWQRYSNVAVTGYTTTGVYMGANTFSFNSAVPETWSVNKLEIHRP